MNAHVVKHQGVVLVVYTHEAERNTFVHSGNPVGGLVDGTFGATFGSSYTPFSYRLAFTGHRNIEADSLFAGAQILYVCDARRGKCQRGQHHQSRYK